MFGGSHLHNIPIFQLRGVLANRREVTHHTACQSNCYFSQLKFLQTLTTRCALNQGHVLCMLPRLAPHLLIDTHVGKAMPFSMVFPLKTLATALQHTLHF